MGAVVTVVFGLLASSAFAGSGSSAADQYGTAKPVKPAVVASATSPGTSSAASTVANATPAASAAPSADSLPLTGFSLAGTVLIGAGLVGTGILLRRRNGNDAA